MRPLSPVGLSSDCCIRQSHHPSILCSAAAAAAAILPGCGAYSSDGKPCCATRTRKATWTPEHLSTAAKLEGVFIKLRMTNASVPTPPQRAAAAAAVSFPFLFLFSPLLAKLNTLK